ncbi:MAG: TetR/AcrR family transcriptional regulator [Acidimicrobiales bacterium]
MSLETVGSARSASLRDRQAEATRRSIADAFLELAHEANSVSISMPAVARKAGVSVRTLYRYFATKDELQDAVAYRAAERAHATMSDPTLDRSTLARYLGTLWRSFADDVPAVLAEHTTPVGRQLRASRLADSRATSRRLAPEAAHDPEAIDLLVAVTSSSMFLDLVARMGHPPERAAALATYTAELVAADVAANGPLAERVLPNRPLPPPAEEPAARP